MTSSHSKPLTKVRIVCISDTHNHGPGSGYKLPAGDVLIHAGDLTNQGSYSELTKAASWLATADFEVKVVVAGNHELSLDSSYALKHPEGWRILPESTDKCRELIASISGVAYLQHSSAEINVPSKGVSLRVFGSPYSPHRPEKKQNWAFQCSVDEAEKLWDAIPADTDVLVTHTPPAGIRDDSLHWQEGGCPALIEAVSRVRPLLHVCGHCHEGRGAEVVDWTARENSWSWIDPGIENKKQSLLDLTGSCGDRALDAGRQTAVVNASIMARSWGTGGREFNKPIVVNVNIPSRDSP